MDLTPRQLAIFEVIQQWVHGYGYPPTVREIGGMVGLSSPASVQNQLAVLEDKGYIRRQGAKRRALKIVRSPLDDAGDSEEPYPQREDYAGSTDHAGSTDALGECVRLPLLGQVAAGRPILAEENIDDHVEIPLSLARSEQCFVLRVQGESMVNAGILDGDFVIVRQQATAENGDIVVALLDGEATIKRFFREKETIRLQPENDAMEPIYSRSPRIVGRVSGVVRSL